MQGLVLEKKLQHEIEKRQSGTDPFAVATVVRTVSSTAARPGDKAVLDSDGAIVEGFLGGGCVRAAVARVARDAMDAGEPKFLSLRPEELLDAEGVAPGEERDGVRFARNGCPSEGSLDIFVEPIVPLPKLMICGSGKVAQTLVELSAGFEFNRFWCPPKIDTDGAMPATALDDPEAWLGASYCVVATQGQGDEAALKRALETGCGYVAFVGSRRKFAKLSQRLQDQGVSASSLARISAPAGLNINAITPKEIALSILAEIVQLRRAARSEKDHPDA